MDLKLSLDACPPVRFHPKQSLVLKSPPPLDPVWLAHEAELDLGSIQPITDPKARQQFYSHACRDRNAYLLSGRDSYLNHGIEIRDIHLDISPDSHQIPIRYYQPTPAPEKILLSSALEGKSETPTKNSVIYYHGGGLCVGDLDSEDLTCRRIVKELNCTVYSVDYHLMPVFTADDALQDAMNAILEIMGTRKGRKWIVMGSSSGGQLAAMVSQQYHNFVRNENAGSAERIHGVLLRSPVTCDATNGGVNIPPRFREFHTSMSPAFHTSLLSTPALTATNRTKELLPLEVDVSGLPRHLIQVCTNDIYYSDGVLYAEALREAGVEVKLDVLEGWPHTFWLKAPELDQAVKAEADMIDGLRWMLEND